MAKHDHMGDLAPQAAVAKVDREPKVVKQLQELLGEAGHVFKCHGGGIWQVPGGYKDRYAGRLAEILHERPNLAHRLLKTSDRLVKSITYRALEMSKEAEAKGTSVRELFKLDDGVTANPPGRDRRW